MKNLNKQDLTGKTIYFNLVAAGKGKGKVYKDSGSSCLVDIEYIYGGSLSGKTIVIKNEITKVIEEELP
jgi:hypothetical protein